MDALSFIASLVASLAWPLAIVAVAVIFRHELRALMPLLRRLKAGPVEAEFEKAVQEIKEAAPAPSPAPTTELQARQDMLIRLIEISPRSAILEAWLALESVVRRAAMQYGGSPLPNVASPVEAMRALVESGILTAEDAKVFHSLRGLRSQAAHLPDFTPRVEAAHDYVRLAGALESRLTTMLSTQ